MSRIRGIINQFRRFGHKPDQGLPRRLRKEAPTGRERSVLTQTIKGQLTTCSFCQKPCDDRYSKYNVIAMGGKALICSNCITSFNARVGLTDTLKMDWSSHEVLSLKLRMERLLFGQPGSVRMKMAATEVALRICRQTSDIYAAQQGKQNQPVPLRMFVKGSDANTFFALLRLAVEQAGIIALDTTVEEYGEGKAESKLALLCCNDKLVQDHAVVFVKDGPVITDDSYAVVCMAESDNAIELDGYDKIELA